jgi:hypothetical protein
MITFKVLNIAMQASTEGSSTRIGWNLRAIKIIRIIIIILFNKPKALSFSMYCLYSSTVVAPFLEKQKYSLKIIYMNNNNNKKPIIKGISEDN